MLDLHEELRSVVAGFNRAGVSHALCGGLAMAVYGVTRATVDIDLVVAREHLEWALEVSRQLGYSTAEAPLTLAAGRLCVHRVCKPDLASSDHLALDLMPVTAVLEPAWAMRQRLSWLGCDLWVIRPPGLVAMKRLRGSTQDLADIERLQEVERAG